MKLVVGLGNPGRKYEKTRHNIGFDVVAELARRHGDGQPKSRFQGETVDALIGSERLVLLSPTTFMNNSGASVLAARDFFKLALEDLLVVCDDLNLPLAKLRYRARGSAGGQKGLADAIQRLGTEDFSRLRIGIGSPPPRMEVADFVLSKFRKDEITEMEVTVQQAADSVADWVRLGIDHCMNRYNS